MRPTFRKLEVKDIGNLERLVADNIDGVEPGLKVVDSRLLLGQAAIDLVGLDSKDSLVLIALDFSADDGLLLRVMDAYSWCLEYPDTLRRLYPMAQATPRPPRILFVVEKMTDAFLRRVKQLSFLEIDCLSSATWKSTAPLSSISISSSGCASRSWIRRARSRTRGRPAGPGRPALPLSRALNVESSRAWSRASR
jgi:hypothetical protein